VAGAKVPATHWTLRHSNGGKMESRRYAHILDEKVKRNSDSFGVQPSPDAIGGYYGVGWYEHFRDRNTGEIYQVFCSDGTYGGKDAYTDEDLQLLMKMQREISDRVHDRAKCYMQIIVTRDEAVIMSKCCWQFWLDAPGEGDVIGYIGRIPIIHEY
jgi:hypothetical protein